MVNWAKSSQSKGRQAGGEADAVNGDYIQELVRQVVKAYLDEQLKEDKGKSLTILFGYPAHNLPEVLGMITPLLENYHITFLYSQKGLPVPLEFKDKTYFVLEEMSFVNLKSIVKNSSILIVPVASYQFLTKLALTIDDELAVWLAIQYQLEGKPIIVANDHIALNAYQQIHAPYSVQDRLQSYIRQLQADQVKWVPLKNLEKTVEDQVKVYEEKKSLILAKHIETAFHDGWREMIVPKRSQLTPAAWDIAKELGIQIKKTDSLKGGKPGDYM